MSLQGENPPSPCKKTPAERGASLPHLTWLVVAGAALVGLLYLVIATSALAEPASPLVPAQPPLADYGDAPDDGTFYYPTLYTTTNARIAGRRGPFHLDVSQEWLGPITNTATLENDANVVNLDLDDGNPFVFVVLTSLPAPTWFWVDVSIAPTAISTTRYLNVLIDHDNDNRWALSEINGDWPEWVMQNVEVRIPPGEMRRIQSRMFAFSPDLLLFPVWVRATLTTQPIAPATFDNLGWDGSGPDDGFASGETEDWWITRGPGGPAGGGGGIVPPIPPPSTTKRVIYWNLTPSIPLPEAGAIRWAGLQVENYGRHTTTVTATLGNCTGSPITVFFPTGIAVMPPGPPGPGNPGNPRVFWSALMWPIGPPDARRARCRWTVQYDPDEVIVLGYDEIEVIEPELIEVGVYTESLPLRITETHPLDFPVYAYHTLEYPPPSGLLLTATVLPADAVFPPVTGWYSAEGTFEWTPGLCDAGFHEAVFMGMEIFEDYTFTTFFTAPLYVVNYNRPPDEIVPSPSNTVTVTEGQSVEIALAASDPDVELCVTRPEDRLFLSAGLRPTAPTTPTVTDNGDGTGAVFWQTEPGDAGRYTFVFTATDLYDARITTTLPVEVVGREGFYLYLPLVLKE